MKRSSKILLGMSLFFLLSLTITITPSTQSYGFYACECMDSCAVVYEISPQGLSKSYPNTYCGSQSNLLPTKWKRNENSNTDLLVTIPLWMLFEPRGVFGNPDAYDQGGYIFSFEYMGIRRNFLFDPNNSGPFYKTHFSKTIANQIELMRPFFQ